MREQFAIYFQFRPHTSYHTTGITMIDEKETASKECFIFFKRTNNGLNRCKKIFRLVQCVEAPVIPDLSMIVGNESADFINNPSLCPKEAKSEKAKPR